MIAVVAVVLLSVVVAVSWVPRQRSSVARQDGQIFFSEVNYHDVSGLDKHDFLEIHNGGISNVALTGWCISAVNFCFDSATVLNAGATVVVSGE
jgi:hypothetical protein